MSDREGPTYEPRELLQRMAECAWHCGDPGVQYDTTINRWHTCPNSGRINASNPCSEYMFLDDTACNLASINLMKFRQEDGTFDVGAIRCGLPHLLHCPGDSGRPRQLSDAADCREQPLLPSAGVGLFESGQPDHDQRAALRFRRRLAACAVRSRPCCTERRIAPVRNWPAAKGPFERYGTNRDPMLRVMQMHRDAVEQIDDGRSGVPEKCGAASCGTKCWR